MDGRARAAYDGVSAAAERGMREFFATGDFNAVGRAAAEARRQLVECVVEDVRSGRADLTTIAEFVVDAALARAARCAQGASGRARARLTHVVATMAYHVLRARWRAGNAKRDSPLFDTFLTDFRQESFVSARGAIAAVAAHPRRAPRDRCALPRCL